MNDCWLSGLSRRGLAEVETCPSPTAGWAVVRPQCATAQKSSGVAVCEPSLVADSPDAVEGSTHREPSTTISLVFIATTPHADKWLAGRPPFNLLTEEEK